MSINRGLGMATLSNCSVMDMWEATLVFLLKLSGNRHCPFEIADRLCGPGAPYGHTHQSCLKMMSENNFRAAVPDPLSYTNSSLPHSTHFPLRPMHRVSVTYPWKSPSSEWLNMSGLVQHGNGQTAISRESKWMETLVHFSFFFFVCNTGALMVFI